MMIEPYPGEPGRRSPFDSQSRLINIAYRLLGSLADAEDAVQETYARWYALTPAQQQAIADVFLQLGLIPKAINISSIVRKAGS